MARMTLWRAFRRASTHDVQLQHLVDLTVLTRAVALYGTRGKWAPVGDRLGLHPSTLGRVARRIAGRSLQDFAAAGPVPLVRLVIDRIDLVLGTPDRLHAPGTGRGLS